MLTSPRFLALLPHLFLGFLPWGEMAFPLNVSLCGNMVVNVPISTAYVCVTSQRRVGKWVFDQALDCFMRFLEMIPESSGDLKRKYGESTP